jgi:acetate---CoA ligase (ADP-forming)
MSFERLFHPRGIAIIGASADLTRIGGHPLRALQKAGYKGGIFPVNPRYPEIVGLTCYPTCTAIKAPCDVAIVAVPAPLVAQAVRDCGEAGIGFAIVLTAGFRETGAEGAKLEEELKAVARQSGVRLIGPNCQGLLSLQERMWAVFGSVSEETELQPGGVSCAFQSGGFGYAIVNLAELQGVGFRYCVSSGNETDVAMPELLSAFLDDPGTHMVFGVMEGTPDARGLIALGRKSLSLGKPVLIWKSATSEVGAKAAQSHTANMTGRTDLYRAAFRQAGLIEAGDVEPIVDVAKLVAHGRLPKGRNVGVLSISGGSGIVFADRAAQGGLKLPPFSEATVEALRKIIPAFGSIHNPADVTAGIFNDMSLLTRTIEIVLADDNVDQLCVLLASIPGAPAARAAEAIAAAAKTTAKPISVGWSGRRSKSEDAYRLLEAARVAVIPTPVRLAEAAARLAAFATDQQRLLPRITPPPAEIPSGLGLPAGACTLDETQSKALLAAFGIPTPREVMVPASADLAAATRHLQAPFAVKVSSADITHKSDVGGVKLDVAAGPALADAAAAVVGNARRAKPDARIDGVLVAEMAAGLEVLIGVVNDPAFGPCVALGLGGVLTEVLGDITYRVAPFDIETARDMIGELKGARLFQGYRGSKPTDVAALAELLVTVSRMAAALQDRLQELDINPVFVRPAGAGVVAADALVVLR